MTTTFNFRIDAKGGQEGCGEERRWLSLAYSYELRLASGSAELRDQPPAS
jgi:hypothetical protein